MINNCLLCQGYKKVINLFLWTYINIMATDGLINPLLNDNVSETGLGELKKERA